MSLGSIGSGSFSFSAFASSSAAAEAEAEAAEAAAALAISASVREVTSCSIRLEVTRDARELAKAARNLLEVSSGRVMGVSSAFSPAEGSESRLGMMEDLL